MAGFARTERASRVFKNLMVYRLVPEWQPTVAEVNEALATAVGEHGARLWLKSKGRTHDLALYDRRQRLKRQIIAAILKTKGELQELYARTAADPVEQRRAMKTAAFTRLRDEAARLRATAGVTLRKPPALLNNASLNSVAAYYTLLPGFERLLAECGSVPAFLHHVRGMKPLSREQRRAQLQRCAIFRRRAGAQYQRSRGGCRW